MGRLALVAGGEFGHRVSQVLTQACPGSRNVTADALADAFAGDAAAVVVIAPCPAWASCERADELAYHCGKTWLPIVLEHPVLRVGPLVRPPAGPCFACYRARRFQHDTAYAVSSALNAAYDADPSLSPAGYLPQHARLAAAVATRFLARGETGHVVTFDLVSWRGAAHRVLSCHGCDREQRASEPRTPLDLTLIAARLAAGS
jgi:bacteriocin biosynthesis cyclodehydratase domain-containing protein